MKQKILIWSLIVTTLIGAGSSAYFYFYSDKIVNDSMELHSSVHEICRKLSFYEEKEKRIYHMAKTLRVIYNLSDYEARYYCIIFDDFSRKYKIPWEVYPALIRIESNFNPTVTSPAKAKGMTQVMDQTARAVSQKLGIRYNKTTLWNDVLNMAIGFTYFSEGYTEWVDSTSEEKALRHAIKRYCGGPGYERINASAKQYVQEYRTSVWDEYIKLTLVYKGILYEEVSEKVDVPAVTAPKFDLPKLWDLNKEPKNKDLVMRASFIGQ